jgi:hypothetical protein
MLDRRVLDVNKIQYLLAMTDEIGRSWRRSTKPSTANRARAQAVDIRVSSGVVEGVAMGSG